jgi:hypothetical protein
MCALGPLPGGAFTRNVELAPFVSVDDISSVIRPPQALKKDGCEFALFDTNVMTKLRMANGRITEASMILSSRCLFQCADGHDPSDTVDTHKRQYQLLSLDTEGVRLPLRQAWKICGELCGVNPKFRRYSKNTPPLQLVN